LPPLLGGGGGGAATPVWATNNVKSVKSATKILSIFLKINAYF
jgi:hypothetical protein